MTKLLREKKYIIEGCPTALMRVRFSRGHTYDAQKHVKLVAGIDLRNQHGNEPLFDNHPLAMDAVFYMEIPMGKRRMKASLAGQPHSFRPDLDNLLKFVCDVGNHVLWRDDSLIVSISAKKIYTDKEPKTEFTIKEI